MKRNNKNENKNEKNKEHNKNEKNKAKWSSVSYPGSQITSGNSVYQKSVIGVYTVEGDPTVNGYVRF